MKKVLMFAAIAAMFALTSCNFGNKPTDATDTIDSVVIEEVDSVSADTVDETETFEMDSIAE